MKISSKTFWYWAIIAGLFALMLASQINKTVLLFSGKGESAAMEYANQPWHKDGHPDIAKALAASNATDCGQFKYREHPKNDGEFLVYCSNDGASWQSYLVWPRAGKALGPYPPDPTIVAQ